MQAMACVWSKRADAGCLVLAQGRRSVACRTLTLSVCPWLTPNMCMLERTCGCVGVQELPHNLGVCPCGYAGVQELSHKAMSVHYSGHERLRRWASVDAMSSLVAIYTI